MRTVPYYPNLEGELVRRGIADGEIATALNIAPRTLRNKRNGIRPFTWPEVDTIQKQFLLHLSMKYVERLLKQINLRNIVKSSCQTKRSETVSLST